MAMYKKDVVQVLKALRKYCETKQCYYCELKRFCAIYSPVDYSNSDINEVADILIKFVKEGEKNGNELF